jgi:diguanylate cyclase (GGDEF)-like protein
MKSFALLNKRGPIFWTIVGLIGVFCVGIADFLTGWQLSFSIFYLIPIMLVTWFAGRNLGLVMSIASTIVWFTADNLSGQPYSHPIFPFWNAGVRLGFFILVSFLLPALKEREHEKENARRDDLTGAANRRQFFEAAQAELERFQRYQRPFTIVYFDIDDFKTVNDQQGHQIGDQLLCSVVNRAKLALRKTDFLARLGGDEFVAFLPETGAEAAHVVVAKLQEALSEEMRCCNWPVTFSMGAVTCLDARLTTDELLNKADTLMYSVKNKGKNAIAYAIYAGLDPENSPHL